MNLFILSLSPEECAIMMMDKHIVKILLEAVQMLSTAKRLLDPYRITEEQDKVFYKAAHKNHPVTIWVRKSYANYKWTLELVEEMHKEWRYRYGHPDTKFHKSYLVAQMLKKFPPPKDAFKVEGLTPFAMAMPVEFKENATDPIEAYKSYYMSDKKQSFASWKNREMPSWYIKK